VISAADLLRIEEIDDPFFASRGYDFTPVERKDRNRHATHVEVFPGQIIVIDGSEIVHQLQVLRRKLKDRIRELTLARVIGAIPRAREDHATIADSDSARPQIPAPPRLAWKKSIL
jgi:hypothetical protein